jgi:subtilase family serine protease
VYDTYARIAADNTAQVVVTSWGICEPTATVSSLPTLERPLFEQMARNGQTVLAAAGDSGSAGCYAPPSVTDTSLAVLDPASQPTVTAVGGTSFAGVSDPDISWHTAGGAGGGGISRIWPMPRYQAGATAAQNSPALCNAPTGSACRQVPDISVLADPTHGYVAYVGGTWRAVGGTGSAAATFAGILALIDERCVAGPVGFINPALYRLASTSAVVDVTQGPNTDLTGTNGGAYPPATGVDLATGLGRPDAAALATALCPPTGAAGAGTITVDPNLVLTNSSTSLTFRYTPASGTGMVNGELDITVPGTWSLPTTTPGQPGYTTADAGVLTISGNTIVLRSITLPANSTVTVTFGDTSGGPGARTPSAAQITTFATASAPASAGGARCCGSQAPIVSVPPSRLPNCGSPPVERARSCLPGRTFSPTRSPECRWPRRCTGRFSSPRRPRYRLPCSMKSSGFFRSAGRFSSSAEPLLSPQPSSSNW